MMTRWLMQREMSIILLLLGYVSWLSFIYHLVPEKVDRLSIDDASCRQTGFLPIWTLWGKKLFMIGDHAIRLLWMLLKGSRV